VTPAQRCELLTDKEREVLRALAEHGTHKAAARALGVNPPVVNDRLRSAFPKLGVADKTRAVVIACKGGVIE
jgi:DNA-binding NarL/FixJ family response regulator